jgi:hypothetical protein
MIDIRSMSKQIELQIRNIYALDMLNQNLLPENQSIRRGEKVWQAIQKFDPPLLHEVHQYI